MDMAGLGWRTGVGIGGWEDIPDRGVDWVFGYGGLGFQGKGG
ncbi:MAG: hypothetical protein ACI8QZ_003765, partial [Chlamydiales bacterium]